MLPRTLQLVRDAGLVVFTGRLSVNLVLVRRSRNTPSQPTDSLECWWMDAGAWNCVFVPCDTEPGHRYLELPINPKGTAILSAGQYRGAYELGLHKGRPALVQRAPVKVYRDSNKDDVVDYDGPTDEGLFGINLHDGDPEWSAGCPMAPAGLRSVLDVCERSRRLYGSRFTVTLVEDLEPEVPSEVDDAAAALAARKAAEE